MLFEKSMEAKLDINDTNSYLLTHMCEYPKQRVGSVDCSIYLLQFMEHLLKGEELDLQSPKQLHRVHRRLEALRLQVTYWKFEIMAPRVERTGPSNWNVL